MCDIRNWSQRINNEKISEDILILLRYVIDRNVYIMTIQTIKCKPNMQIGYCIDRVKFIKYNQYSINILNIQRYSLCFHRVEHEQFILECILSSSWQHTTIHKHFSWNSYAHFGTMCCAEVQKSKIDSFLWKNHLKENPIVWALN